MSKAAHVEVVNAIDDAARLGALRSTGLLDSGAEEPFDRLTRMAAKAMGVPVALVSLVDDHRQFFKSCVGLPQPWASQRETPLSHSFCQHAVTSAAPLIINDARTDPRVTENLAIPELGVVAYAGIPLTTAEGHVLGSFCVIDTQPRDWTPEQIDLLRDLAALVMSEISLRRAKEEAESANRAKDRFLAMLSHELRTPVSPVLLIAASMADDQSLPPQVREDACTIRRNIVQQTRLIDDLLDVTRIENSKLLLRREGVDLHAVLTECVALSRPEANTKGVDLFLRLRAKRHTVDGDPARLRQVFSNLLKNAIKFTPARGSVTIDASDAPQGKIRVLVSDTGAGMGPEVLPKIFSPFEQGQRAITDESSGLGLGLAICKGVVEAHSGTLGAFSEGPGHGTIMTVELATTAAAPKAVPAPAQSNAPGGQPLNILLVDDHHDTLRALTRLLKKLSHTVTPTDCKATALAAAANADFDLVISDIGLPDGTGLELMRELSSRRSIPGIAVTGYGTEADIDQTRAAGFIGHLTKPIDFRELEKLLVEAAR